MIYYIIETIAICAYCILIATYRGIMDKAHTIIWVVLLFTYSVFSFLLGEDNGKKKYCQTINQEKSYEEVKQICEKL